jgi:acetylornithine deacetylase/succinyl-diaminopimelate desuccinylase-like protein
MNERLVARVLHCAVEIQQIPAPTFGEAKRASFVKDYFQETGLHYVSIDEAGNVYGQLPGGGVRLPVVVSAHLDTVFSESVDLSVKRSSEMISGPGIGDNSIGVASLLGLVWALQALGQPLPGDLWLVANVCEEGLGNLNGMRRVVDRFGDQVAAYIVLEGMSLEQIFHRGASVQRYRITVRTSGGHSWVDYGRPNAIDELAALVCRLNAIELPEQPRTVLNVGVFNGGTTVNSIAAEASIEVDLRSEAVGALKSLVARVNRLVKDSNRLGVKVSVEAIGQRPAGGISADHPLVLLARRCLEEQGIHPGLNTGSTDANIPLSHGIPAVCVGITTGGGAHTPSEFIHTRPVRRGLASLVNLVQGAYLLE